MHHGLHHPYLSRTAIAYSFIDNQNAKFQLNLPRQTIVTVAHPRKPPYRHKNLADISYTDRVIANCVPNFVAMATRVGRGKMRLAAFDGPSPKTPL